ncbi:MAG: hypothetical protein IT379_23895 [Deltaproteobacteria bacterium]|nr:hypothetical protein [Deltaproteobacteria bacterium]
MIARRRRFAGALLVVLGVASGCGDDDGGGTSGGLSEGQCRADDDCASRPSFETCAWPGAPWGCGVPCMAQRLCSSDADCTEGDACEEYVGSCCTAAEPSSWCVARCSATSCAADETCDGRLCVPRSCDAGFACPAHTTCAATDASADAHGCVRARCERDADCSDDGYCVLGSCHAAPGECRGPAA